MYLPVEIYSKILFLEVRVHVEVDDPDALIDQKKIEDVDKQWDQEQNLFRPSTNHLEFI